MGIRFLRLAGTSAGAINTALMTVIGKKEETKSEKVLQYMCDLDFFKLVDGHPTARRLIKEFITDKDFSGKVEKWVIGITISVAMLLVSDLVFLGLQKIFSNLSWVTLILFMLTGVLLLFVFILVIYIITLLQRLKDSGLGINPGNFFYSWIEERLGENQVVTVRDLIAKAEMMPNLFLRKGITHPKGLNGIKGEVTFIASELVTQNKIQFPKMCHLFRHETEINQLQPAGFIRASMSIPIFFESYYIREIPNSNKEIREKWINEYNEYDPPHTVRFVDGGILSNFPIDIFYDPSVSIPRLPVFGIDLDDSEPRDQTRHTADWSFLGYFGRLFNTVRYYYDKDFLLKNKMFQRGIGKVSLSPKKFNWLNFFLKPDQMKDMFIAGAEAATDFLIGNDKKGIQPFNWEEYKKDRSTYHQQLLDQQKSVSK